MKINLRVLKTISGRLTCQNFVSDLIADIKAGLAVTDVQVELLKCFIRVDLDGDADKALRSVFN